VDARLELVRVEEDLADAIVEPAQWRQDAFLSP
jgi:hypothetical protein